MIENTLETNKNAVRRYFLEMWNDQNSSLLDVLVAEDYLHHKADGSVLNGREPIRMIQKWVWGSYPNIKWRLQKLLAEGDQVASLVEGYNPEAPEKVLFRDAFFHRVQNGVLQEGWVFPSKF